MSDADGARIFDDRRALDHVAIDWLQRAYADTVNRRDWPVFADMFLPDTVIDLDLVTAEPRRIEGPTAFGEFLDGAMAPFTFFEFVILNSHIVVGTDGDPDRARARMFMCELRVREGEDHRNETYGVYRDDYVRTPAGWRFAHRRYRSMARFPSGDLFGLPAEE